MLKLTKISHCYGEKTVLENVTLSLCPGQRLAIMGASGTGKTTLLRIAMGLLKSTGGTVENTFSKTAVVFQEPRLLPWLTAAENVNLVLGDTPATMDRAREILSQLELSDAAEKYPKELSGGMQQRVALARAMAAEGDLLILDEPFKAMDEALRARVIAQVAQTHGAILLVTHEEWEAKTLGCEIFGL